MTDGLGGDIRYALRALRREPSLVIGVISTFALAIGTNAAMLGLVSRLMLAPPPGVRDADRLMRMQIVRQGKNGDAQMMTTMSYPTFRAFADLTRAFSSTAAEKTDTVGVGRGADLEQVPAVEATGQYFATLGVPPEVGRLFGPADDELPTGQTVAVLGYSYWQRRFGGERAAIGREIVINGDTYTIIGVAPNGFNGDGLGEVDVFLPLTASQRSRPFGWWTTDGVNVVSVIARLAPNVAPSVAAEMATAVVRARRTTALDKPPSAALDPIVPGASSRQSAQAQIALWLSGVSLVVLLIATANVGTLLLLRAARRRRDVAVRIALGAGQSVLARQLLTESVLLALGAAAAGLVLSRWFGDVLRLTLLPNLAPSVGLIDRGVLVASVVAAVLAGVVAGLAPLMQLRRRNVVVDLRAGESGASGRFTIQNVLIGIQVALCTVLLVGAGLFVRSLERVQSQDLGFTTSGLLYAEIQPQRFVPGPERDVLQYRAADKLRGLGQVRRASVVEAFPFGPFHVPPISIPGMGEMPSIGDQLPYMYGATPEFLKMTGVTLRQGRLFTDADGRGTPLVALVNETMARVVWPNESAIGKCIRAGYGNGFADLESGGNPADHTPCREVVGVVRDSRARSLRVSGNETRFMQYYIPFSQLPTMPSPNASYVNGIFVQVTGDMDRAASLVQRTIQSTSAVALYAKVRPYQDLIDPQLRSWRLGATLFSAFSALALGIAAVGLFGVVSYVITQRTREIGVRLALGATRVGMSRMVVTDALRLVAVGLVLGACAAMAAGPLVQGMLFQTSPWEPANLLTAILVLVAVAIVAAVWPAWRASRVDPLVALRSDT
ncbi:MAG: ADOP family duplicated permease [Gemmatimonadaceae bacterium]